MIYLRQLDCEIQDGSMWVEVKNEKDNDIIERGVYNRKDYVF